MVKKVRVRAHYRQTGKTNTRRDKLLRAKKPGKRRSKSGNVYYESRKNRSDVNPLFKL